MAQVGYGGGSLLALGPLDEEMMLLEDVEEEAHMLEVGGPRVAEDQDVVKEDEDGATQERLEDVVHECLNVAGALHSPNGMTRNT